MTPLLLGAEGAEGAAACAWVESEWCVSAESESSEEGRLDPTSTSTLEVMSTCSLNGRVNYLFLYF